MLFWKKKEELSDQRAVYRTREAPRFELIKTGVIIKGFEGEGQLGNISVSGCYIGSGTYAAIIPSEVYQLRIIPAADEKIEPFSLMFKATWTKSTEKLFQAGFSLDEGQSNTQLKQYVELLRSRGVQPDYGNMDSESRQK